MSEHKAQNSKHKSTQHIRKPVHAKIDAQKSPRERQQHHDPAILRHAIEHRTRHGQVVHRMARRETVLVKRRHFGLDQSIRSKRTRTPCAEFHSFINHKAHSQRNKRLPQNREKTIHANLPNQKRDEQSPNVAIAQAYVKTEPAVRFLRKMTVRPIHRHTVVKFRDFLEHEHEFRILYYSLKSSSKPTTHQNTIIKKGIGGKHQVCSTLCHPERQ